MLLIISKQIFNKEGFNMEVIFIGLAGFIGAILRISIGNLLFSISPESIFPFSTLFINLVGSYLLAYFLVYSSSHLNRLSNEVKVAISTGLLGSFTTFSTFSVETLHLFESKQFIVMILYILLSFVGGFLFSWSGYRTANFRLLKNKSSKVRSNEL